MARTEVTPAAPEQGLATQFNRFMVGDEGVARGQRAARRGEYRDRVQAVQETAIMVTIMVLGIEAMIALGLLIRLLLIGWPS